LPAHLTNRRLRLAAAVRQAIGKSLALCFCTALWLAGATGDAFSHGQHPIGTVPATAGKPLDIPDDAPDIGYDENTVCMMADLVSGYVLPTLNERFFRTGKGVQKLPSSSQEPWERDSYTYIGDGVLGVIRRNGADAFFQSFRIDGKRFPKSLRSRRHVLDLLDWAQEPSRTTDANLACDQWTVHLYFSGDTLDYGVFSFGKLSND